MPNDVDDDRLVEPDGLAIRSRRHARGWSPRDLVEAIARAHERATGVRETIRPTELAALEESGARVSVAQLRLIAGGLDCNPVELIVDRADRSG
ncbi:MAG: hypothetical protein M5U32_11130 [Myxococcota bacterium]|nr:hypothetical protein [Myxococcota bacterium]